ncbi:MAG: hypothetical protein ACYTG2_17755 [Planctomycetota bacterium]|jgi:hypothetical protein
MAATLEPPEPGRGVVSDVLRYVVHRPEVPTLVRFGTDAELEDYSHRIAQRVGIDVTEYSILNIHKIGIDVPARYVFEQVLGLEEDSPIWPNHIATSERNDGSIEHLRVVLLGRLARLKRWTRRLFGDGFGTLFELNMIRLRQVPDADNFDNARYLLWECSGGYPIGTLTVYVRSPIAQEGEVEPAQVFFAVGFNFYGKRSRSGFHPVHRMWEAIHNRVTSNVLNRFKRLCESRFADVVDGASGPFPAASPRERPPVA